MKKVKVVVKDKTLLELAEDAKKGDLIDLKDVVEVDTSYLDMLIESRKEKVYESKLAEFKKRIDAENAAKIIELNSKISSMEKQHESDILLKSKEIEGKYHDEISELKNEIDKLKANNKNEIDLINSKNEADRNKLINNENEKYAKLEQQYNILKSQFESQVKQAKIEIETEYKSKINEIESNNKLALANKDSIISNKDSQFELEKMKIIAEQKDKYDAILREKEDVINNLQRAKAAMNVKQTGEDLEAWCDNEVTSYMQNGLFNCTWEKDNKNVREEDETKGSKADYIFKVFASNSHLDDELLASVCMDMKDENPDSINKKSNADYYKQLDKNREKKNCKYALLVSNLEMDKPNVLPIFKVREYENMYVVRPAYLMTFLNMIASLTTRFSDLILSKEAEELELKSKFALLEEFEEIKKTYLDKPLELLEKAIIDITKSTESITKAVKNIDEQCDKINRSYINQITEKINKYELKLNRSIAKKLEE